jgi:phasin family protein
MNHASEQFKHANQAGVEALATVANTAFGAMERMAALNLSTVRSILQQRESGSRRMLAASDAQTLMSLQAGAMFEETRRAMSYSQRAFEISTQTRNEIAKVLEQSFSTPS